MADIAGIDPAAASPGATIDSVSFLPHLATPSQAVPRTHLFSERFFPLGLPPSNPSRAIRDDRYKLTRRPAGDEVYDLLLDPFEQNELLQAELPPAVQVVYQELSSALESVLSSD